MEGEGKEKKSQKDQTNDDQKNNDQTNDDQEIHVVKEPIAKAVISDIFKKVSDLSKFHPDFKEGITEGYKNPEKCFRNTDGNDSPDYYNEMVKSIRNQINNIAGSGWGPKYHTKRRAATPDEVEEFKKLYTQKFGSLGLDSILFGFDELPNDGIKYGDSPEGSPEGSPKDSNPQLGGSNKQSRRRRRNKKPCRQSRRKKPQQP